MLFIVDDSVLTLFKEVLDKNEEDATIELELCFLSIWPLSKVLEAADERPKVAKVVAAGAAGALPKGAAVGLDFFGSIFGFLALSFRTAPFLMSEEDAPRNDMSG